MTAIFHDKTILVTGGTGSMGRTRSEERR
ncbi:MAG: hypothetical protein QG578_1368, partial [Thermodesulfobacteriota bacterium]|nr:hypothetical protein [Thermodesulfobacteriota bacterium]